MPHTFFGVYPNGSVGQKFTNVSDEETKEWMDYCKSMRFGRAQIVDGKCVYRGLVNDEVILRFGTIGKYTESFTPSS